MVHPSVVGTAPAAALGSRAAAAARATVSQLLACRCRLCDPAQNAMPRRCRVGLQTLHAIASHVVSSVEDKSVAVEKSSPGGRQLGAIRGAEVGSPEWMTRTATSQRPTVPATGPPSVVAQTGGVPYSDAQTTQIVEQFKRDGYYFLGPTLEQREVQALRSAAERKLADPRNHVAGDSVGGSSLFRMFEFDVAARDLIVREPFASLAGASATCTVTLVSWARQL